DADQLLSVPFFEGSAGTRPERELTDFRGGDSQLVRLTYHKKRLCSEVIVMHRVNFSRVFFWFDNLQHHTRRSEGPTVCVRVDFSLLASAGDSGHVESWLCDNSNHGTLVRGNGPLLRSFSTPRDR